MFDTGRAGTAWDDVVGQPAAVQRLKKAAGSPVHAYLLVGPPGSTKRQAARAFAAELIAGTAELGLRDVELVRRGEHPDVREIERAGAAISAEQAREIVRLSSLAPIESDRKILLLDEFHLLRPEGAALLLKTIEEPPASTIFLILADFVPADLITISSRCARIEFSSIPEQVVAERLVSEGADPGAAGEAATASRGNLDRARVLASDPELAGRRRAFLGVPARLDGSGANVMTIVDELLSLIDAAAAPLAERHAAEVVALEERIAQYGERGSGKKTLEERHKRELRRHRADELRNGLSEIAAAYRDALAADTTTDAETLGAAVAHLHEAIEYLERNPNEPLLLQSLLWSLPSLGHA